MRGFVLNEWALGMTLLTGAWVSVAVAMAGLMVEPPTGGERIAAAEAQVWQSTHAMRVSGTNPCTGAVVVLDIMVTLDVTAHVEGEDAQVLVVAGLAGMPSPSAPDDIVAATSQFGFFATLYGQRMHVHDLRARLTGQSVPADLVIAVEQGVDGAGRLFVTPGATRVTCG